MALGIVSVASVEFKVHYHKQFYVRKNNCVDLELNNQLENIREINEFEQL